MDDLRENIQLEKLRALKPLNSLAEPLHQMKAGLNSTKMDPKAMGKELADEVSLNFLVRKLSPSSTRASLLPLSIVLSHIQKKIPTHPHFSIYFL
jgi:hypothetical protein